MGQAARVFTGTAAGVPFTALPPAVLIHGPAPLIITWHLMDAPCTDAAFAAALPLTGVPAWRVHLGMPWCGARNWDGGRDAAGQDPMMKYVDPVVRQAAGELPAALTELRTRFPLDDGPIGVVGGSLGGMVALYVLAQQQIPISTSALVNPAIRARSVVAIVSEASGRPYPWDEKSSAAADRMDFVSHAGRIAERGPQPPLLVVSGELDLPQFRTDAADLVATLRERYARPDQVALVEIADLAHPLAEPPGLEPAPQLPTAKAVDEAITDWFVSHPIQ
jgi:pimeloyl-ACP methyl ester carboxylesterase